MQQLKLRIGHSSFFSSSFRHIGLKVPAHKRRGVGDRPDWFVSIENLVNDRVFRFHAGTLFRDASGSVY
jgi:hypothetical protein